VDNSSISVATGPYFFTGCNLLRIPSGAYKFEIFNRFPENLCTRLISQNLLWRRVIRRIIFSFLYFIGLLQSIYIFDLP